MSVKIGQFRRNQKNVNNFFQIAETFIPGEESFIGKDGVTFYNELTISLTNGNFKEKQTYYIKGGQVASPSGEKCTVKLISEDGQQQQIIGKFSGSLDFTFTPNREYKNLVFAFEADVAGYFRVRPTLYSLGNVCGGDGTKVPSKVKKIGIQGMPGLRFSINGEDFIMGKSGIFMLGDMDITQISFYIRDFSNAKNQTNYINYFPYITDGKEFFIMDYEY